MAHKYNSVHAARASGGLHALNSAWQHGSGVNARSNLLFTVLGSVLTRGQYLARASGQF
jgi:hypothetical protein